MKIFIVILSFLAMHGITIFAVPSKERSSDSSCDCVCGVRGREQKIVGGAETQPNEYPWIAGLFKQNKLYCGAAIISQKYLLTAAHCVSNFEPREIRAFVGGHNISRDYTEKKRIKKIIYHDDFDIFSFDNDIALLELDSPILYGPRVSSVCLPSGDETDFTNRLTVIAGWGRLGEKSQTSSTLRSVIVPIWSSKECMAAGYGATRITENMMCGGYPEGEKDACQGDSGGPMVSEGPTGSMEVVGIVSWGRGCARKSLPGIYTKITNYLDWIHEHMEGECMCQRRIGEKTNYLEKLVSKNKI
ncbi:hypothetical protein PVAND_001242 [Polypedilum vanderplanki]|uniref:Peptidase S1 domain-containing protein n=1 Tax=Polypedilum vanderplanki TaxID=319348 RepID=A0A9J6BMT0_POLVA|nr:hypothetical protein PVAND_001242 [Polypedilum vanderplanki]